VSHVSHGSLSLFGLFGFFGPSVMLHAPFFPPALPRAISRHLDAQGLNVWRCTQVGTGQQISPGRSQHHCLPWSAERPPGRPASSGLLVRILRRPLSDGECWIYWRFQRGLIVSILEMMICKLSFLCMVYPCITLDLNTNQTPKCG